VARPASGVASHDPHSVASWLIVAVDSPRIVGVDPPRIVTVDPPPIVTVDPHCRRRLHARRDLCELVGTRRGVCGVLHPVAVRGRRDRGGGRMTAGWPVVLTEGRVALRPLRQRDSRAWRSVRMRNASWLHPWEATSPDPVNETAPTYAAMVRRLRTEARDGRTMPFVVTYDDELVGQLTVGGITWGSLRSAYIGYWVDQRVAGRGIIPTAVAMATDHCFAIGLHRVEINIRPENVASRRVVEKLGFRPEGLRPSYLHIDGDWRDHLSYALTVDDVPGGLLARWTQSRTLQHP